MKPMRAWLAVALLSAAYLLAIVDRGVLALFIQPIEHDLGVSDAQMGLLYGFGFALLYALAGVPLGWLADRVSRRNVAGLSVVTWSAATVVCGLAPGFSWLFAARVAVGVGEAGLSPVVPSWIGDSFPADRTAKPMTFYSLGGAAGPGVALLMGGAMLALMEMLSWTGSTANWRSVFIALGLLGLLFSLTMFLLVPEPARRAPVVEAAEPRGQATLWVRRHSRFFAPHILASGLVAAAVVAITAWTPARIARDFGWSEGRIAIGLGVSLLLSGPLGVTMAGLAAGALQSRGANLGHMTVGLVALALTLPTAALAPLCDRPEPAILLTSLALAGLSGALAVAPAPLVTHAPGPIRGRLTGIYLMAVSLIGYGGGAWAPGQLSDWLGRGHLGAAISTTAASAVAGSMILALLARYAAERAWPQKAN